jgi:hypothetical protein
MLDKTNLTNRANRRLYEEYLLNKWISIPANQAKVVMYVCNGNPNLLYKELVGICSFEPIDFKPEEEIENSYTERVKNWLVKYPEQRTQRDNLDVLYEKQVKDYLIKTNVKTIFGVQYTVTLLCEVRSRLSSRYMDSRLKDLQFLYDDIRDDPRQQQLFKDDDIAIVHSKTFMSLIISMEGSRRANLCWARAGLYKVSHSELKALQQKHGDIFRK